MPGGNNHPIAVAGLHSGRLLLRELGDTDEQRSLTERFRRTQRRMESGGSSAAAGDKFSELGLAVHAFHLLTHEKVYTKVDAR